MTILRLSRGGTSGSSGGGGADAVDQYYAAGAITDDPFSAQTSYIVDTTHGGAAGASTTVDWFSGSITGATYSTFQAALTAATTGGAGAGANRRVCLLGGQTINVASSTYLTCLTGGTSNTARFVVQGDCSGLNGAMPKVDFQNGEGAFNPVKNDVDVKWLTIRGIEWCNNPYTLLSFYPDGVGAQEIDGLVVEYCYIHDMISTDNSGGVGLNTISYASDAWPSIRYNFFEDIYQSGQSGGKAGFFNQGALYVEGTPGGYFHHNEVYNCTTSIYHKNASSGGSTSAPNGWIEAFNIERTMTCGYRFGGAGATTNAVFGAQIYNNLYYDIGTNPIKFEIGSTTPQCDGIKFYNNTLGQDVEDGPHVENIDNIEIYNNLFLHDSGGWNFHSQESAGDCSWKKIDYNAYKFYAWFLNRSGSPNHEYTSLANWRNAKTADNDPELAPLLTANPDPNCYNVSLGRTLTNSDVNNTTTRDYAPSLAGLLTAGEGGGPVGCYNASTIAASALVGRGWT